MTDKEKRRAVRKAVAKAAKGRIIYFMPDYIAKQVNLTCSEILKYLKELTQFEPILKQKYKFICPYCSYVKIYECSSDIDDELICPHCGEEMQAEQIAENTYLIFCFVKD